MDQTLDEIHARSKAADAGMLYRSGVKADFDRLYRAMYQRTFAADDDPAAFSSPRRRPR
jgi:hypothetical protein